MQFNFKFKILILIFFIFLISNFGFSQEIDNSIIISWQTSNFVPVNYKGKVLPSPGSIIIVNLEFFQNGKIVNLDKEKIYWYVNNELISNTKGVTQINFMAPNNKYVDIRVNLPEFNIIKTIEIPITKPRLIIDAPFPKKEIYNNNLSIKAIPYFFNINTNSLDYLDNNPSDLDIKWKINGKPAIADNADPFKINIEIKGNDSTNLLITATAQNINNILEFAKNEVDLKFIKK